MVSETPVRNQFGSIIGLQPKDETDAVKATLDASLKAVGATPPTDTPTTPLNVPQNLQQPSWRVIITGLAVLSIGVLAIVLLSGRTQAPPRQTTIVMPTVTVIPTPQPTALPSVVPQTNPHLVTIAGITVYGDYDEDAKIGSAPEGL